jgi:hypothetical protein
MSPSRTRRPTVHRRPRSEVVVAVAVSVGIVVSTVLVIWALRPGEPGVPGGGGLLARQPRVTLLVVLGAALLAAAIWWVAYGRRRPRRVSRRLAVAATAGIALAAIVLAGIFWPGGLVRHYPSFASDTDLETPPVTAPPVTAPAPTIKRTKTKTTAPAAIPPTPAPGPTTVPTQGK